MTQSNYKFDALVSSQHVCQTKTIIIISMSSARLRLAAWNKDRHAAYFQTCGEGRGDEHREGTRDN